MGTTSVDRRKLHEQVWSVPGSRLASLYRISDVALAKTCKQFDVPRPPRGYWARIAAGQRVRKPPLPHPHRAHEVVYTLDWDMPDDSVQRLAQENRPSPAPPPPTDELHRLAAVAEQQLSAGKPGPDGRIATPSPAPEVRVSEAVAKRAVSLLSALFHRWEARGGSIAVNAACANVSPQTSLAIGADSFGLRLEEVVDESKPLIDPTRLTQRLALYVTGDDRHQFRRRWWDTTTQRVERMLGPFVETVANALDDKREDRLDAECVTRQRVKVEELRKVSRRDVSREFYWRQELIQNVQRWTDAQQVRGYLSAMRSAVESGRRTPPDAAEFERWHEWASRFADSIDPIGNALLPEGKPPALQNAPTVDLDLTSSAREVVDRLGVTDAEALWRQQQDAVRRACDGKFGTVWNEITRVLEGLGYDVSKREQASDYW